MNELNSDVPIIRNSYTYNKSDNILEYNLKCSSIYVEDNNRPTHFPINRNSIHEYISKELAKYLLEEGHITFKEDRNIMTGDIETIGTINIFDMNKFNERYIPEYLV